MNTYEHGFNRTAQLNSIQGSGLDLMLRSSYDFLGPGLLDGSIPISHHGVAFVAAPCAITLL